MDRCTCSSSVRVVALSDPKWCDQVLRARPETFTHHSGIASVSSEMGIDGVFSAEGNAWRRQRRLAMLALAPSLARLVSEAPFADITCGHKAGSRQLHSTQIYPPR
jgi:cytochrome P450